MDGASSGCAAVEVGASGSSALLAVGASGAADELAHGKRESDQLLPRWDASMEAGGGP